MQTTKDDPQKRQSNTLPPDIIGNDRHVDDVLWNGPRRGSWIQKAGGIVIGGTLVIVGLADVSTFYKAGARFLLAPMLVLAAFGARILYKALRSRK